MAINVKKEVASGAKWNTLGQFTHYGVQFGVSLVLARVLLPEEFGLVGMLSVFLGISTVFIQSGLSTALIQKKDTTTTDYSTVFFYNIAVSLVFYLLLFFSSNAIANFYQEPKLENLAKYAALVFVLNAGGVVQSTILRKELKFKALNIVSILGAVISAVVAIVMALRGAGVYSLVGQSISYALVTNLFYWLFSDWKPSFIFSRKSFKQLFGFGSKLLGASILDRVYMTVDTLIIGKVFSAGQLGYYSRAKATRDIPIENTTGILTSIVFPIFTKLETNEELKHYQLKFLGILAFLIFPVMTGLIVVAEPLTIVLFSDAWLPSVNILKLLCIVGPATPLSVILVQTILAKGEAGLFLKLDVYKKIVGLIGMSVGLYFGFYAFIIGVMLATCINLIINFIYTGKLTNTSIRLYIKTIIKPAFISVLMGLIVYYSTTLFVLNVYFLLSLQVLLGFVFYMLLSVLFRVTEFNYFYNLGKDYLRRWIFKRS